MRDIIIEKASATIRAGFDRSTLDECFYLGITSETEMSYSSREEIQIGTWLSLEDMLKLQLFISKALMNRFKEDK